MKVKVIERFEKIIEVDATVKGEAVAEVQDAYNKGRVILTDKDVAGITIEVV